jgi:hypothetical protein
MGEEPLAAWWPELLQPLQAGLFTLPAWWATNPYAPDALEDLHLLRRRLKRARYGLANLAVFEPQRCTPWIEHFKSLQAVLGDLQDLVLMDQTLTRLLEGAPDSVMPTLCSLLTEARDRTWMLWLERSSLLRSSEGRANLLTLQALAPSGSSTPPGDACQRTA